MSATSDTSRMSLDSPFAALSPTENRVGLWLSAAGAVIVVLAAVFYLVLALGWRSQPFPGAMMTRTLTVDGSQPLTAESWTGLNAGLQSGDHVIGVNGMILPSDPASAETASTRSCRRCKRATP